MSLFVDIILNELKYAHHVENLYKWKTTFFYVVFIMFVDELLPKSAAKYASGMILNLFFPNYPDDAHRLRCFIVLKKNDYRKLSNKRRTKSKKLKWFSSRLALVFAQSIEAKC